MARSKKRQNQQPIYNFRIRLLIEKMSKFESGYQKLLHAYRFAHDAHLGQVRLNGKPFFSHPFTVALLLRSRGNSLDTVIAGLLHDVVEDCGISRDLLDKEFGEDIAQIVWNRAQAVTAKDHSHIISINAISDAFRRSLLDPRVAEISLCDRLVNLQSVDLLPDSRKDSVIKETLEIFVPIARLINKADLAEELELVAIIKSDDKYEAQRREYDQLAKTRYTHLLYPFPLSLGDNPFVDSFRTYLKDFDSSKSSLHETSAIPDRPEIARKLSEIQESLEDMEAPSLKDLLGSIGPIDLKGLWLWADYLLSYSKRAKATQSLIEHPNQTTSSELTQLDRKIGGVIDVLIAVALRSKTSTINRIAGFIKHLKGRSDQE